MYKLTKNDNYATMKSNYNLREVFMEKFNLEIEKYSFVYDDNENYFVYAIPSQKNKEFTEFHIQKENYGFVSFCIALNMEEMNCTKQEFINENIMEWINSYEDDIEVLEEEREFNN